MPKSAQAFRTIREVADWLDVAAHVLRFWESKFSQIKPVKRAGGRRYYRPADMELVGGIKVLLHDRGLTIRGVQKMISDEGVDAVAALSPPIDAVLDNGDVVDVAAGDEWEADAKAESAEAKAPETAEDTTAPPISEDHAVAGASLEDDDPAEVADKSEPPIETPATDGDHVSEAATEGAAEVASTDDDEAQGESDQGSIEEKDAVDDPVAEADDDDNSAPPEPAPVSSYVSPGLSGAAAAGPAWSASDPAEGAFGQLAALAALPGPARAPHLRHIAALARLQQRMATPPGDP